MQTQQLFKVQDLNQLIKLYAYQIQQRFQEISKVQMHISLDQTQNNQVGQFIIDKYQNYTTSHPVQVKYIQKLVQRIIQIFTFFKNRSKHQHLLAIFQEKINSKFQNLLAKRPLEVGQVFTFIIQIVKQGFFTRIQPSNQKRRVFTRVASKQGSKVNVVTTKPRRTVSVVNTSHSINKVATVKSFQSQKMSCQQAFTKLYSIMNVDKMHFLRTIDHSNNVLREMLQRNQSTLRSIKSYSKRVRTQSDQFNTNTSNTNILSDLNNNNRTYIRKGINAPSINNWINRKRRITTAQKSRNNQNTWCS